jgi:hypothetical protein
MPYLLRASPGPAPLARLPPCFGPRSMLSFCSIIVPQSGGEPSRWEAGWKWLKLAHKTTESDITAFKQSFCTRQAYSGALMIARLGLRSKADCPKVARHQRSSPTTNCLERCLIVCHGLSQRRSMGLSAFCRLLLFHLRQMESNSLIRNVRKPSIKTSMYSKVRKACKRMVACLLIDASHSRSPNEDGRPYQPSARRQKIEAIRLQDAACMAKDKPRLSSHRQSGLAQMPAAVFGTEWVLLRSIEFFRSRFSPVAAR